MLMLTIQISIKNESINILTEMMRIFSFIDMNESTSIIITFILTVFIIIIIIIIIIFIIIFIIFDIKK